MGEYVENIVVGAGVAGIFTGLALHKKGKPFLIIDPNAPGGVIQSVHKDGYTLDTGANSMALTPFILEIIQEIGFEDEILYASDSAKVRSIVWNHEIREIPRGFKMFFSRFLTLSEKSKLLLELFTSPHSTSKNITIKEFFERHFGKGITEKLVDPIFTGIYAGDISKMRLATCQPKLLEIEQRYGSIIRGMMKEKWLQPRQVISFKNGMQSFLKSIVAQYHSSYRQESVVGIREMESGQEVELSTGNKIICKNLYLCTNAVQVKQWFSDFPSIDYAPMQLLFLSVNEEQNPDLPNGFGYLVPSKEKLNHIGCIYSSSIFKNRAPKGQRLYTMMIGGATKSEDYATSLNTEKKAIEEFRSLLNIHGKIEIVHKQFWNYGIPKLEYDMQLLDNFLSQNKKGITFAGNYDGTVAVGRLAEQSYMKV